MPALPDSLDLSPSDGAMQAAAPIATTDFGLGNAAETLHGVAMMQKRTDALQIRVQAQKDRQAAQPDVLNFQNKVEDQFAADAGKWNGQPGFASDQIAKATAMRDTLAADPFMTPGVRSEFLTAANNHIAAFGQQAIAHERNVIMQNTADDQAVTMNAAKTQLLTTFAPAKQSLLDNFDGSQKGLTDHTLAAFDAAAAPALAAAPPQLQPKLQAEFSAMRVQEAAGAAALEQHGQDAFILKQSTDQAGALINSIVSNPAAYDSVVSNGLPSIIAALPAGVAGMKKDLARGLMGEAAAAQVHGWLNQGSAQLARAALNDGRYDQLLDPKTKESLLTEVDAAARANAPKTLDQALAQDDVRRRAQLSLEALSTTGSDGGLLRPGELGALSLEEQAKYLTGANQARKLFAVGGAVRDMSSTDLMAAAHGVPDPTAPDYEARLMMQKPAADELARRQSDAGSWAWNLNGPKTAKGVGAAGGAGSADRGQQLQQQWQSVLAMPEGPARAQAAASYASAMLGSQAGVGIGAGARAIVPKAVAGSLAANVINAPPEAKLKALTDLAGVFRALPAALTLADGSIVSPRQLLARQMEGQHVPGVMMTALGDLSDRPGALASAVAAINDPTVTKPGPNDKALQTQVHAAMAPYLASVAPLDGSTAVAQNRIDLAVKMARREMASGASAGTAAADAAKAWTSGYQMVGGMRVPVSALQPGVFTAMGRATMLPYPTDSAGLIKNGTDSLTAELTANKGANIYAAPGVDRQHLASWVAQHGQWTTSADDSGATLMVPRADGSWYAAADKWGRPIHATWNQLTDQSQNRGAPFFAPPPSQPAAAGQPLPAFSRNQALGAVNQAVETVESHGRTGLVSPQGAMGVMQVLPTSAAPVAQRLFGAPLDVHRLQWDDDYNRKIGQQILADAINRRGPSAGGLALAISDYHAGPGNTDAMIQRYGDPRQGVSIDAWQKAIAATHPHTSAYVGQVLPQAFHYLTAGH